MISKSRVDLYGQANLWADQLRFDSSFTISDVEELKSHLLDIAEDLISNGLCEEEAFLVATSRLGKPADLRDEYGEINTPIIQLRKAILVMSGVLVFSLLYYFLLASIKLLVLVLDYFNNDYVRNFWCVVSYTLMYILTIVTSSVILNSPNDKRVKFLNKLNIRPVNLFLLLTGTLVLALIDRWVQQLLNAEFYPGTYTNTHLYSLFDYLNYIFPLILIICFIVLYRQFCLTAPQSEANSSSIYKIQDDSENELIKYSIDSSSDEETVEQQKSQLETLEYVGLSQKEALLVMRVRLDENSLKINNGYIPNNPKHMFNYEILLVFSSVLVYFFLHFLLNSTSRILISILQHFENNPELNIRHTYLFIIFFQWFFVLLTAMLYFYDKRIIQLIKSHHIKLNHTLVIFLGTIFFAVLDRLFLPISKGCLGNSMALKYKLTNIIYISDFTFPFILCACFLVLFGKYYRDNIKTC